MPPRRALPRLVVPAVLLLAAGCYPTAGLLERVPTVPAGHLEWGITAGAEAMTAPDSSGKQVFHVYPDLEASVRQGLTDNLELGGRLWLVQAGGRIDLKWQAVRSPAFDLSVAPGVGLGVPTGFLSPAPGIVNGSSIDPVRLHLPVLLGIRLGDEELVVAPQLTTYVFFSPRVVGSGPARLAYLAPQLTVGLDIDTGTHGHLLPEVDVFCAQGFPCTGYLALTWTASHF